jgi:hypothetical protein
MFPSDAPCVSPCKPSPELDEVRAMRDGGVILPLVIPDVGRVPRKTAARSEGVQHGNIQLRIHADRIRVVLEILEPRFIDGRRIHNLRFGQLHHLIPSVAGIGGVRKIESADAGLILFVPMPGIAALQRNVRGQLIIDARADRVKRIRRDDGVSLRRRHACGRRKHRRKASRARLLRIDQRIQALLPARKIDEEGKLVLDNWTAQIRLQILGIGSRHRKIRRRDKRIPRIKQMIAISQIDRSVKSAGSRLGQNLNTPASRRVILR